MNGAVEGESGIWGMFHRISDKHLDRYIAEFMFRWNNRKINDFERTIAAIVGVNGKRFMWKVLIEN